MVGNYNVHPVVAVKDLEQARQFYEDILGLEVAEENSQEINYHSGDTYISVYLSGFAGTNQATSATWEVEGMEDVVEGLLAAGVTFEHYEMEGISHEGPIHVMKGMKAAWFKDPDGNILCVHEDS
ncbi:MAG: VOC family protein [Candidatus Saccharimonadales bacterium]